MSPNLTLLLAIAFYGYGFAALLYLFSSFKWTARWDAVPFVVALLAWLAQITSLALEPSAILLWLPACLVMTQLYRGYRGRSASGFFVLTCACLLVLLQRLAPHSVAESLPIFVRDKWFYSAIIAGCLSFAVLLSASFTALTFLVRDEVRTDSFLAGVSGLGLILLPRLALPSGDAPQLLGAALAFFSLQVFLALWSGIHPKPSQSSRGAGRRWLMAYDERVSGSRIWGRVFSLAGILMIAALLLEGSARCAEFPYRFVGLIGLLSLGLWTLALARWRDRLAPRLPTARNLNRDAGRTQSLGFYLMTVSLALAIAWKHQVRGEYWGANPWEAIALGIWVYSWIALHANGRARAGFLFLGSFILILASMGEVL